MPIALKVFFAQVIAIFLAIYLGQKLAENSLLPILVILGVGIVLVAIIKHQIVAFCLVVFAFSGFTAPFIPSQINFYYLFILGLIAITLLRLPFWKSFHYHKSKTHLFIIGLGIVFIVIMAYRGAGFRLLGDESWGGMNYIKIFLSMILVYLLPYINLSEKMWPRALVLMALLSAVPVIMDVMTALGTGVEFMHGFIQSASEEAVSDFGNPAMAGLTRIISLGKSGSIFLLGLACIMDFKKFFRPKGYFYLLFPALFLVLTLLSGFRIGLVTYIFLFLIIAHYHKIYTLTRVISLAVFIVILFSVIVLNISKMPLAIQRTFSWVPGVKIDNVARESALSSNEWRFELWNLAMENLPQYWLIGKGYAFSFNELVSVLSRQRSADGSTYLQDQYTWAIVTGNYHNGILSTLLGLGIFGLIFLAGFMISACYRHHQFTQIQWCSDKLKLCHMALTAYLITQTIIFWVLYGDVRENLPPILFIFACLEALLRCDKLQTQKQALHHP